MNTDKQFEQALRETLRGQAAAAPAGPDGPSVLKRARLIRRHRRQGMAALTAAAVAVVVVPLSLALPHDAGSGPGPAGHTDKPTPTQTATPSYRSLEAIPQGTAPTIAYVGADGLVHDNGSTTQLPGGTKNLSTFGEYRGNWVVSDDMTTHEYDPTGKVIRSGPARGIKYSADRTQIAFQIGNTVYTSSRNTMGNGGAQPLAAPSDTSLLGFLPDGPAVTTGNDSLAILGTPDKNVAVPMAPLSVSQSANLVGGITGTPAKGNQEGAVIDLATNAVLWHNGWRPNAFSDDGKYVIATPVVDNGTPASIAILDARTGRVIARTPRMKDIYLDWQMAWDNDRAVFTAFGGTTKEAILALDLHGKLTRVSSVAPMSPGTIKAFWFGAQP